jgi:hypothetical protein
VPEVNRVTKLIDESVAIQKNGHRIVSFRWRGRFYRVNNVIGWWREPVEWWNGKTIRLFVRVSATNSRIGTYELYKLAEGWFIHRVID